MELKEIKPFKYVSGTPEGYECSRCHVTGVKLWREWNTFLEYQQLLCQPCVKIVKKKYIEDMDETWKKLGSTPPETDQLGGMAPAVPTEDGSTFWGYASVPEPGVQWWKSLPVNDEPQKGPTT